jgi:hypothetical protein
MIVLTQQWNCRSVLPYFAHSFCGKCGAISEENNSHNKPQSTRKQHNHDTTVQPTFHILSHCASVSLLIRTGTHYSLTSSIVHIVTLASGQEVNYPAIILSVRYHCWVFGLFSLSLLINCPLILMSVQIMQTNLKVH